MAALAYNADAKRAAYARVDAALTSFFAKYPSCDVTGRMASVNSFLRHELHDVMSFIGFYVVKTPGEMLQIGPYQGAVLATGTRRALGPQAWLWGGEGAESHPTPPPPLHLPTLRIKRAWHVCSRDIPMWHTTRASC
ncbi:hypothetical protein EON67_00730 [archaeon]|nr:MAG: hypothetical protein EON67_00730 [archaeon]